MNSKELTIGTNCQICDSFIPIINIKYGYPRICDECKKRLKKLLYEPPKEDNLKGDKSMIIIRTNLEELPTTCCDCPLKTYDPQIVWKDALMTQWGGWVCPISSQRINNTKREEFCPLEEIPERPKEET